MKHASGRYLAHLDSDDWVSPGVYDEIIREMERKNAVMGMFDVIFVEANNQAHTSEKYLIDGLFESAQNYISKIFACNAGEYMWHLNHNKIWKTSLLKEVYSTIPGNVHLVMCEDLLLSLKCLLAAQDQFCISNLKAGSLYYYQHESSSTNKKDNLSNALKNIQDLIQVKEILLAGESDADKHEKIIKLMKYMSRLNHPNNRNFVRNPLKCLFYLTLIMRHLDSSIYGYKLKRVIKKLLLS